MHQRGIDLPEIGTTLSSTAVKTAAGPATNALLRWGKQKYDKFLATYTNVFSEYVSSAHSQCSKVKNILYRNQLANTDEKYVNVFFEGPKGSTSDGSVVEALKSGRHILLRGRGGAGKTMFTKWAILRLTESLLNHQKIPIYIELRDLPSRGLKDTFEELVFDRITSNRSKPNFNQFLEGLKAGLFSLVLDAADEISKPSRPQILRLINRFRETYSENSILLTTRDFAEIDGLTGFEQLKTTPLSFEQAISIIEKLDYDQETKDALKEDLQIDDPERHAFFLENPLLVTILLLTYDQSKDIPTKRTLFYKRAFEALYERHDGAKGIYRRDHHAGLPMDEFEKVFSTFCYGTYVNSLYVFESADLPKIFKAALDEADIDEDANLLARDASESTCLLVREGHDFVFVHRSFQEYFAALFIKEYRGDDVEIIYKDALSRGQGENILEFLYEMNRESLEKHYVIPLLEKTIRIIDKHDLSDKSDAINLLSKFYEHFSFTEDSGLVAGLMFSKSIDSFSLLNLSPLYSEANTLLILSPHGLVTNAFKGLPREKIIASRSSSRFSSGSGQIIKVKFTPSSAEWIDETVFIEQLKVVTKNLRGLYERLTKKPPRENGNIKSRFGSFVDE